MNDINAFKSYAPKEGFYIRFANGEAVSVIWHEGAYADGGKNTCEVMAPFHRLADFDANATDLVDGVRGRTTPDELVEIMAAVAALSKE